MGVWPPTCHASRAERPRPLALRGSRGHIANNSRFYFNLLYSISDECGRLPEDIYNLVTSKALPVKHGTRLEVTCNYGYTLSGDSVITCVKDANWEFDIAPFCVLGYSQVQFLSLSSKVSSYLQCLISRLHFLLVNGQRYSSL